MYSCPVAEDDVSAARPGDVAAGPAVDVTAPVEKPGEANAEIWARLTPLFLSSRDAFFRVMNDHGLTPPHGHALMTLCGGAAKMRDLAEQMSCDASYVTNVVDRLEELGLAKRQESAGDRRVREVILTSAGETAAADVAEAMSRPPVALSALSERDRAALLRILRKIGPLDDGPLWRRRNPPK